MLCFASEEEELRQVVDSWGIFFLEHFEKSRKCSTAAGLWWVRESRRRIGLYLKILRTTCDRNLIVLHRHKVIDSHLLMDL